jgi:hypothetical protein
MIITSICLWQISFSQTVSLASVQFYVGEKKCAILLKTK